MRRLMIIFLAILSIQCAYAGIKVGDLYYNFYNTYKTATVVYDEEYKSRTGTLLIPSSVTYNSTTYSVTSIDRSAFEDCTGFTGSLTIPNSVTSIGYNAFRGCTGFTGSLTIPNSVTEIGGGAFDNCTGFTGSLTIGNSVTSIGYNAFRGCTGFTGPLTIPNSVTEIGTSAFDNCSGFTGSLTIGSSVSEIKSSTFNGCKGFTGFLEIPNSVTSIGERAFDGCSGFNGSLTIGNSVTKIDGSAFWNCNGLTSVTIPGSVTSIGLWAFEGCNALTRVNISDLKAWCNIDFKSYEANPLYFAKHLYLNNEEITDLIIPDGIFSIKEYAFYECTGFTGTLTFPNSVTSIGKYAFYGCSGFTGSLTIPDSVTSIGDYAFDGCSGFNGSLTIGNSVTEIGAGAFYKCDGFKGSLAIPESVTSIGDYAFWGCKGFTGSLTIGDSVTSIGDNTFSWCSGFTGSLTIPDSVTSIGEWAFAWCSGFNGSLTIGDSVTSIGRDAFYECTGFRGSLTIGNSVTSIGNRAFFNCRGLAGTLTIPNSVIKIGDLAFENCGSFSGSLTIPNSVTSIGSEAFYGCWGFKGTLTIGSSVTSIGERAFYMSTDWTQIQSLSENPPSAGKDAFLLLYSVPLYVSAQSVSLYKVAPEWEKFYNIGPFPVEATGIVLNKTELTMFIGEEETLIATLSPEDATTEIVWTSGNDEIVSVNQSGVIHALSEGTTVITATVGNLSASCKVTVNPVAPSSIELSLQEVTLFIGSTITLTATLYPENVTNNSVNWTSSNPAVATVDEQGTVTALQEGDATITATCGTASATCKVTVSPISPASIELNIKDMVLFIGQSETLQAIVRPLNTTYPTVLWQSEDESVATVSANGTVTGVKEGLTIITATCGEVSAICTVTVNPIPASNIEITTGDVTLTLGGSATLAAKVSPDNTTHPEVAWSSSDIGIAMIDVEGTVTAIGLGTAIITAKCGNVSATCTVRVIPVPSEGIVVSPTALTMLLGDEYALVATVYPESTTDKNVTWGSDNPGVASVSSNGVVTALSVGSAIVTASNGTSKATCKITVNPVVPTGISLNVMDETLFVASTTQLVATISPNNVTDKTITWTTSKPEIATVSDQGEVFGVSVGTTTVTATIGTLSASCQINVVHRIPDMDPVVTSSNRDIVTIAGRPVNMAVYAEGGEPSGWSYLWTKNGETVSRSSELNITAINNSETVIAETYRVKVENEIDKVVILSEIFDFVVQIYPAVNETPDGSGSDISITTGTDSPDKTREGNIIILSTEVPNGGYPQGWEFIWNEAQKEIGEGETVETVARMSPGTSMAVQPASYNLSMTNYGPEGDIWAQFKLKSNPIAVYRRPQTPLQMLRKGDGTSHTFVTMMTLSDLELEQLDYEFIYGWTDAEGSDHFIEQTNERYCHTDAEIYDDPTNKFWVYSIWLYSDGCMVSSGLRYLDGSVDEDFDASVFDGSFVSMERKSQIRTAIYTIDGQYMGTDITRLVPGIYIYTSTNHGMVKTEKIIIR